MLTAEDGTRDTELHGLGKRDSITRVHGDRNRDTKLHGGGKFDLITGAHGAESATQSYTRTDKATHAQGRRPHIA